MKEIFVSAKDLITVGDVVTASALEANVTPMISIVDKKTRREKNIPLPEGKWDYEAWVCNPPETLTDILLEIIDHAMTALSLGMSTLIIVEGEEDLASLPCIVKAPAGTTIIYGLPDVGAAVVLVDEESKRRSQELILSMEEI
ncbi:MAG: DUF359 domain-containing protein [Thermoplasmata archaeon]|nr:DUF359 domain-containing protein [Thermoplasmata archaeon]